MKKACIYCGNKFIGRADKKYCSSDCRSAFHNQNNTQVKEYVKEINKKLKNNRQILAKLNPTGKKTIKLEDLQKEGFDFNYFTNVYKTKKGHEYRFCYDYGYLIRDEKLVTLVIKQSYVT